MDLPHLTAWLEPHRRAWCAIAYRDFVLGTILGMGALVIALAGFAFVLDGLLRRARPAA